MQVTVKMLTGDKFHIDILPSDTIASVKGKICHAKGIAVEKQRLIFAGKQLQDTSTVSEHKISGDTPLHLVTRLTESSASSSVGSVKGVCDVAGACGLQNLGNTCYMNSTLQALSNTLPLRRYYEGGQYKDQLSTTPISMEGRLANSFAGLLRQIWEGEHITLAPTELKKLIAEKWPQFAGYRQHDAQELLMFLLDGLHEDVNRAPYPRPIVADPASDGKTQLEVAREAWAGNLRRNDSKIMDVFGFQVRSEITFLEIDETSLKFEPMMYLSLPIPKPTVSESSGSSASLSESAEVDLMQCLDLFTKKEELEEDDWVECEKTKQRERSLKKLDMWSAPECLIIHLKRFSSERLGGPISKVNTFVRYPMDLDLRPWICGPQQERGAQYQLNAVVNHCGGEPLGNPFLWALHCARQSRRRERQALAPLQRLQGDPGRRVKRDLQGGIHPVLRARDCDPGS
eukprot:gb/GFBE01024873.1/.p1 GENE.gb/GFBE01024873.1/~~gb/GFBE01024873.1/.p1  ORF type:complete len:458 (+),score=84.97 gb/GFBE01024873.1/:1-1374(+)